MRYAVGDNHTVKQDLAMDEAMKLQGLKQMQDMCEWLEMGCSVSFDWRKWVDGYEECPVEDYHQLQGEHKALFVQMINACPNFDACLQAWKDYSLASLDTPMVFQAAMDGNFWFSGQYAGHAVKAEVHISKHTIIKSITSLENLIIDATLDGMAVWVDGVLDFMWGYPNLGPNGYMPATETPA